MISRIFVKDGCPYFSITKSNQGKNHKWKCIELSS
jgi:hypothetical protein